MEEEQKMGLFEQKIRDNEGNGRVIHSDLLRDWIAEVKKELWEAMNSANRNTRLANIELMLIKWFRDEEG